MEFLWSVPPWQIPTHTRIPRYEWLLQYRIWVALCVVSPVLLLSEPISPKFSGHPCHRHLHPDRQMPWHHQPMTRPCLRILSVQIRQKLQLRQRDWRKDNAKARSDQAILPSPILVPVGLVTDAYDVRKRSNWLWNWRGSHQMRFRTRVSFSFIVPTLDVFHVTLVLLIKFYIALPRTEDIVRFSSYVCVASETRFCF